MTTTPEAGLEPRRSHAAPWAYGWWFLVGVLLGLGVESLLSIGALLLLAGAVLAVIGLRVTALRNHARAAVLAGLGVAVLYLAWLNRGGPGTVCETTGSQTSCVDEISPWPFVAVTVGLIVASIAVARSLRD